MKPIDKRVLELTAAGLTEQQVADELGVTYRAVESRMLRLRRRFDVATKTQLVAVAIRDGAITV